MNKKIAYTDHARTACEDRDLQTIWVERTVRQPDWVEQDPHDAQVSRHFRSIPERGGRYMRVALVETEVEILIITAFLDRGAKPK